MKKILACIIVMSIILTGCSTKNEVKTRKFMKINLNNPVSTKIVFSNQGISNKEYKTLADNLSDSNNDEEVILINNGAIVFSQESTNFVEAIKIFNYEHMSEKSSVVINRYDEENTIEKLFGAETNFISLSSQYSFAQVGSNIVTEEEYKHDILEILKSNEEDDKHYIESDVLTQDIKEYLEKQLNDITIIKVIPGKSSYTASYVNRICILGIDTQNDTNINLRVILKLNKQQKVYDIDVY